MFTMSAVSPDFFFPLEYAAQSFRVFLLVWLTTEVLISGPFSSHMRVKKVFFSEADFARRSHVH